MPPACTLSLEGEQTITVSSPVYMQAYVQLPAIIRAGYLRLL